MFGLKKKVSESAAASLLFSDVFAQCYAAQDSYLGTLSDCYKKLIGKEPPTLSYPALDLALCTLAMELQSVVGSCPREQSDRILEYTLTQFSGTERNEYCCSEIRSYLELMERAIESGVKSTIVYAIPSRFYIRLMGAEPADALLREIVYEDSLETQRLPLLEAMAAMEAHKLCVGLGRWSEILEQYRLVPG